jgi:hypothetical protein
MAKSDRRIPWSRTLTEGVLIVDSLLMDVIHAPMVFPVTANWLGQIASNALQSMFDTLPSRKR